MTTTQVRKSVIDRVQVAAAMIAVTAERGPEHVGLSGDLWDAGVGAGCIQGEMLVKLGLVNTEDHATGDSMTVMATLGYAVDDLYYDTHGDVVNPEVWDATLAAALNAAEHANDSGLPWAACLEAFERVLAGESDLFIGELIEDAKFGLRRLRRSGYPNPLGEMKGVVNVHTVMDEFVALAEFAKFTTKFTVEMGNCMTGFTPVATVTTFEVLEPEAALA